VKRSASTGPFYEDLEVGDVYMSHIGRTVTETDNILFTHLILNFNQVHFNYPYAEATRFHKPVVNSTLTLALITGLSTPDTSQNAFANLGWTDVKLRNPVFIGDTLWAETEILEKRDSKSNQSVGIVSVRSRGINQNSEVVIEFRRSFMIYKRNGPELPTVTPRTADEWTV
jgi:itaconyl-CoA hydratase